MRVKAPSAVAPLVEIVNSVCALAMLAKVTAAIAPAIALIEKTVSR
jgi:hypothetical protein